MCWLGLHSNNVAALKLFPTWVCWLRVHFCQKYILIFQLLPFSFPVYWLSLSKMFIRQYHLIGSSQFFHFVFTACCLLTRQNFLIEQIWGFILLKVFFSFIWWVDGKEWLIVVLIFGLAIKDFAIVDCSTSFMNLLWFIFKFLLEEIGFEDWMIKMMIRLLGFI